MPSSIPAVSVPNLVVRVNGNNITSEIRLDIASVQVTDNLGQPTELSMTLSLWDHAKQRLKEEYFARFQLGTEVEIHLGINTASAVFFGDVTSLEPSLGGEEGGDRLVIKALDRLQRLRFGTKQRTFKDQSDSGIASSMASEVGLAADVDDTVVKHGHVTQSNISDYQFLLDRAKQNDYEVRVEGGKMFFKQRPQSDSADVRLAYPSEMFRFAPRMRTVFEGGKVEVRAWDIKTKKVIVGSANASGGASSIGGSQSGAEISAAAFSSSTRTITDQPAKDADEAQRIAQACFDRQQSNFIEAEGECPGVPLLRAGRRVEVTGVPGQFSGIYSVTEAEHAFGLDGYRTRFTARRASVSKSTP